MIKDLWDIAQGLIGLKSSFNQAKRDQKDRISEYFESIGNIIQDTADSFKNDEVPHGKCQQLLDQAQYFTDVVGDTINHEKAEEFKAKLIQSREVELLASEILGNEDQSEKIIELEKIAASFLSLAIALKASQ